MKPYLIPLGLVAASSLAAGAQAQEESFSFSGPVTFLQDGSSVRSWWTREMPTTPSRARPSPKETSRTAPKRSAGRPLCSGWTGLQRFFSSASFSPANG